MHSLPNYARRVEYLESTGTQWIDTGVLPSRDLTFSCRFMCVNINTGYGNVFGTRYASGRREYILCAWTHGFAVVGSTRKAQIGIEPGNVYDVSYDGSSTLTVDGTQITMPTAENFADVGTILAFGIRNGDSPAQLAATRIYGLSLGSVRSFVPCRVGQTGYLYDLVSGQLFGNAGTGDFVLGPDVREGVVPTRLNPFGVGRRQEEIRRVEYLESTGTQWIDTGVYDADPANVRFEMRRSLFAGMAITSQNNASGTWLGAYRVNTQYRVAWHNYNDRYNTTIDPDDQTIKTIVWDGSSGYYEDGVKLYDFTAHLGNNGLAGKTWCLFSLVDLTAGIVNPMVYGGRVYHLAFSVSGTLVRDFVPVAIGSTGYLLDRVSGQLFGNSGTGDFVVGPDKT